MTLVISVHCPARPPGSGGSSREALGSGPVTTNPLTIHRQARAAPRRRPHHRGHRGPDGPVPAPGAEDVDAALGGSLAATLAALGATGKQDELTRIASGGALAAPLIVAVGLGQPIMARTGRRGAAPRRGRGGPALAGRKAALDRGGAAGRATPPGRGGRARRAARPVHLHPVPRPASRRAPEQLTLLGGRRGRPGRGVGRGAGRSPTR